MYNHLEKGTYHNPVTTLDIIPTAISMAGGDAREFESLDGVNILPYLAEDPSERNNLTEAYPEITEALLKKLYAWEIVNDPPRWQLLKKYEKICVDLFDAYRK